MKGPFPESKTGERTRDYTVIYVTGAGHSGSTLLNLLLNAHSQAIGVCELHFITRYLALPQNDPLFPFQHQVWRDVASSWESRTGESFDTIRIVTPSRRVMRSWDSEEFQSYMRHNRALFQCIAEVSSSRVIVDSSKSINRMKLLSECGIPLKVIHLVRDGRGVINSYRRKYGKFSTGYRRWFMRSLLAPRARKSFPALDWITIRYEDLAATPETTLRRICRHAGLEYEPSMLRYWEVQDVSIGGNRMRGQKRPVGLDEKWTRELSILDRAIFVLTGSLLNRFYGYPVIGTYRPVVTEATPVQG